MPADRSHKTRQNTSDKSSALLESVLELIKQEKPKRIFIVGPTASGKSNLAIDLAIALRKSDHGTDIVNADSYARYKYMNIGTAKTSNEERISLQSQYGIKHYQIDTLEPTEESSAHEFANSATIDLEQIELPIICGGSGLYVRALSDGFAFQERDMVLRANLAKRIESEGIETLYHELKKLSPVAASSTDSNNARRIIRALEVIYTTGKFTHELPQYKYLEPETLQIGIDLPREVLDQRIKERTQDMRNLGLEDEVRHLHDVGLLGKTAAKAIGYTEFIQHFTGAPNPANGKPTTLSTVYEMIENHTKRLVRRQLSWFKRDPRIIWL